MFFRRDLTDRRRNEGDISSYMKKKRREKGNRWGSAE